MAVFKCKMCGGTIEFVPGDTVGVCDSCGTKQTLPKTNDDVLSNLFNRANNLRLKGEFDKAAQVYEKIVEQDDSEAEAHWGLVLCKYGIEYVEDPETFERVPTCNRASFDAITSDPDYLAAIDYSDLSQQQLYESEARTIARIQKDILTLVEKEDPYDVFVCYKETDENGKRTPDSVLANDIYYQLTQEGFKVFYAAITLEDKLGTEYEPYIFSALNSAKVMLALGTKPEYFTAPWVKNEWSRYLKLMKDDCRRLLIPCYRNMDPYDLPEEFAHLQAQDMSKIGFINDIVRGIKKVVEKDSSKSVDNTTLPTGNFSVDTLLKRAQIFLSDHNWEKADEYYERILDLDPENKSANLGKLLSEMKLDNLDALLNYSGALDHFSSYRNAVRFGGVSLESLNGKNKQRIQEEKAAAEAKRAEAEQRAAIARGERRTNCETILKMIGNYSNTGNVEEALTRLENKYKELNASFNTVDEKRNSIIQDLKTAEEQKIALEKRREPLQNSLSRLSVFSLKERRTLQSSITEISNQIAKTDASIDALNKAIAILPTRETLKTEIQKVQHEMEIYSRVKGFENGSEKSLEVKLGQIGYTGKLEPSSIKEFIKNLFPELVLSVGDIVQFGTYKQDDSFKPINWIVLTEEKGEYLLLSKYGLECKEYHKPGGVNIWNECSLRKWLNGEFYNEAFSLDEKDRIATTSITADINPVFKTELGKNTEDKVFLLSLAEAEEYTKDNIYRMCTPTGYAKGRGVLQFENGKCGWWLRSPGFRNRLTACAAYVTADGTISYDGTNVLSNSPAVRPAMWVRF